MVIPEVLIFAVLVALVSLACYHLLVSVPAHMRSFLRYKLWKIRDDAVDAVLRGDLPDNAYVADFIKMVESSIRQTKRASMVILLGHMSAGMLALAKAEAEKDKRAASALEPAHRETISALNDRVRRALVCHFLIGCPSGWMLLLALLFALPFLWLFALLRRGATSMRGVVEKVENRLADVVENEVVRQMPTTPDAWGAPMRRDSLSALVG
jgi:hypothetical protein